MKFLMLHPLWGASAAAKYEVTAVTGRVAAACRKLEFFAASCFFSSRDSGIAIKHFTKSLPCLL